MPFPAGSGSLTGQKRSTKVKFQTFGVFIIVFNNAVKSVLKRKKNYIIIPLALGVLAVLGVLVWLWVQKTEGDIEKATEGQYGEMEMRVAENVATIMENMISGLTAQLEIISKMPAIR